MKSNFAQVAQVDREFAKLHKLAGNFSSCTSREANPRGVLLRASNFICDAIHTFLRKSDAYITGAF